MPSPPATESIASAALSRGNRCVTIRAASIRPDGDQRHRALVVRAPGVRRADDGDLLVVDEVGLDLGPALVGQSGEDRHPAALAHQVQGVVDQLRAADADHGDVRAEPAGGVGDDRGEVLARRVDGRARPQLGGRRPPRGRRIGDDHRPGPADHGELQVEQPDRPGPEDDDDVADLDAVLVQAVEAAGQRLGQRELLGRDAGGRRHQPAGPDADRGDDHPLAEAAVDVVPDHQRVFAQVLQTGLAVPADAAGEDRAHPAERADLVPLDAVTELGDRAADLVAEHDADADALGLLPAHDPQVGAADRVRLDLEQDLARARRRVGQLGELGPAGPWNVKPRIALP